jgi:hypothetical protein
MPKPSAKEQSLQLLQNLQDSSEIDDLLNNAIAYFLTTYPDLPEIHSLVKEKIKKFKENPPNELSPIILSMALQILADRYPLDNEVVAEISSQAAFHYSLLPIGLLLPENEQEAFFNVFYQLAVMHLNNEQQLHHAIRNQVQKEKTEQMRALFSIWTTAFYFSNLDLMSAQGSILNKDGFSTKKIDDFFPLLSFNVTLESYKEYMTKQGDEYVFVNPLTHEYQLNDGTSTELNYIQALTHSEQLLFSQTNFLTLTTAILLPESPTSDKKMGGNILFSYLSMDEQLQEFKKAFPEFVFTVHQKETSANLQEFSEHYAAQLTQLGNESLSKFLNIINTYILKNRRPRDRKDVKKYLLDCFAAIKKSLPAQEWNDFVNKVQPRAKKLVLNNHCLKIINGLEVVEITK